MGSICTNCDMEMTLGGKRLKVFGKDLGFVEFALKSTKSTNA